MPSQFADNFRATGFAALQMLHGESVVFIKGQTGKRRTITAIVNRNPAIAFEPGGDKLVADLTIQVEQNTTTGILFNEINKGRDHIELQVNPGEPAQRRVISDVVNTGGGALTIQLR